MPLPEAMNWHEAKFRLEIFLGKDMEEGPCSYYGEKIFHNGRKVAVEFQTFGDEIDALEFSFGMNGEKAWFGRCRLGVVTDVNVGVDLGLAVTSNPRESRCVYVTIDKDGYIEIDPASAE